MSELVGECVGEKVVLSTVFQMIRGTRFCSSSLVISVFCPFSIQVYLIYSIFLRPDLKIIIREF